LLAGDSLIQDKVYHHDSSFGYNSARGYIEEDSVQALEHTISGSFNVGRHPCSYWEQQDGGTHVLAAAIYVDYKKAYEKSQQSYST
jgi:hypothetical protein